MTEQEKSPVVTSGKFIEIIKSMFSGKENDEDLPVCTSDQNQVGEIFDFLLSNDVKQARRMMKSDENKGKEK